MSAKFLVSAVSPNDRFRGELSRTCARPGTRARVISASSYRHTQIRRRGPAIFFFWRSDTSKLNQEIVTRLPYRTTLPDSNNGCKPRRLERGTSIVAQGRRTAVAFDAGDRVDEWPGYDVA